MAQSKLTSFYTSKKKPLLLQTDGLVGKADHVLRTPKRIRDDEEAGTLQTPPIIKKRPDLYKDERSNKEITPSSNKKRKISVETGDLNSVLEPLDSSAKRRLNLTKHEVKTPTLSGKSLLFSSTSKAKEIAENFKEIKTSSLEPNEKQKLRKTENKCRQQKLERLKELQEQLNSVSNQNLKHPSSVAVNNENDTLKTEENVLSITEKEVLSAIKTTDRAKEISTTSCADKIKSFNKEIPKNENKNPRQKLERLKELQEKLKTTSKQKIEHSTSGIQTSGKDIPVLEGNDYSSTKTEALPAYQHYHNLATNAVPSLNLPYKYKTLEEKFRSTDRIVSMLHNRREICTFSKLKASVQEMTKKNFELQHLGQIKQVFDEAYFFQQEKKLNNLSSNYSNSNYHLTITPNLKYNSKDKFMKRNINEKETTSSSINNQKYLNTMTPSVLLERIQIFHHRLLEIVKDHHENFLSQLHPAIKINREKLIRWHPSFNVDEVPIIEPASLPSSPIDKICATAKDVLTKVQGVYNKRIEDALKNVAEKYQTLDVTDKNLQIQSSSKQQEIKGIPSDLLAKIRAKEAENLKKELTRNPAEVHKLLMISRLPEVVRILRNYFITEKKSAVTLNDAIVKIAESSTSSLSFVNVEEHLRLLSTLVPEWLSFINLKKGLFLKINKELNINEVIGKVHACENNIKN